jgi:hypothetical protein
VVAFDAAGGIRTHTSRRTIGFEPIMSAVPSPPLVLQLSWYAE